MARALITAPVARDLYAEHPDHLVARVPGATNGTIQGWDTLDAAFWTALADGQLTIYTSIDSIPLAVKKFFAQFTRYNTSAGNTGAAWKQWAVCTAADFIKTQNGVKAVTALIAGDVPQEIDLLHRWFGNVQNTLGGVTT